MEPIQTLFGGLGTDGEETSPSEKAQTHSSSESGSGHKDIALYSP
jgi:hypothetical protein